MNPALLGVPVGAVVTIVAALAYVRLRGVPAWARPPRSATPVPRNIRLCCPRCGSSIAITPIDGEPGSRLDCHGCGFSGMTPSSPVEIEARMHAVARKAIADHAATETAP